VQLTGSGYNTELITGDDGMAFFPNVADPPFVSGPYDLSVTASGFQDYSSPNPIEVTADSLKKEPVLLEVVP
jgi:hypothetical protein